MVPSQRLVRGGYHGFDRDHVARLARLVRIIMAVALGGTLAGCGGPGLDPNVPPVTEGDWYRPAIDVTWQWQLTGTPNTSYDVELYDLDLFETDAEVIAELHAQGRRVLCYFSAGSAEDWRPDYDRFTRADKGYKLDGWPGERWVDIRSENALAIMLDRLDLAVDKGCDGVEPDNMEAYNERSGFRLSAEDQLGWNRRLANEAHERGLAIALKNDGSQAAELVEYYDLSLNEQCHQYDECAQLEPFTAAGKPILNAEYPGSEGAAESAREELCAEAAEDQTRTLLLPLDLDDAFRIGCDA